MCKVRKSDATQSAEGLDRRGFLIAGVAGGGRSDNACSW